MAVREAKSIVCNIKIEAKILENNVCALLQLPELFELLLPES